MVIATLLRATALGLALHVPMPAAAQNLRVVDQTASGSLSVPVNSAVIVESDRPFAELSIANPAIADISTLSDRTIYVLGKSPGRTTLTLLSPEGRLLTNVEVQVVPEISEFKERLAQILPGEAIEVRTANDGIVLSGVASSIVALDRALELAERYAPDRVMNMMTVGGTQQVMLKVRFAEMSRSVSKTLSGSLAVSGVSGDVTLGAESGAYLRGNNGIGRPLTTSGDTQGAVALGFGSDSLRVEMLLEALERKGLVRTLSEPNLTALSGQEAAFLAGGEFPIPVLNDTGDGNSVSIEYKPFGVELDFTPTVVRDGLINLQLDAAVSSIDPSVNVTLNGTTVTGFSRRETATTIELRDGESFAIAGLLQDEFRDLNGQVPWLGDVPVLGALFRSADYARNQTELVIVVTAHLVTPVRGEALALPTDRVVLPSERDLFVNGRISGRAPVGGAAAEIARQDFSGSYGYVMD